MGRAGDGTPCDESVEDGSSSGEADSGGTDGSEADGSGADHGDGADRRTTRPPEADDRFPVPLRGVAVDPETRCGHYDEPVDVIAFRFPCCGAYYPCFACHEAVADHESERVPRSEFGDPGVLCGVCGTTLSVEAYLACDDACPDCGAAFNPGCRRHHDRYLEV